MPVPDTLVASTSPSPENVPPEIVTVAAVRLRLSGSVTDTAAEGVGDWPSGKLRVPVTLLSVGGALAAGMGRGFVWTGVVVEEREAWLGTRGSRRGGV